MIHLELTSPFSKLLPQLKSKTSVVTRQLLNTSTYVFLLLDHLK